MWKLFILTFLCLFLTTSCTDDNSGDVKKTQIVAAAAAAGSSSDGNSGASSSAAAVAVTSVKTEESSDPSSSGSGNKSNSDDGSYYDGYSSEEDDEDKDCNREERDDDYDCTSAMRRVQLSIIEIGFSRKYYFVENNYLNYNNYCDITYKQGKEGHVGSPLATWYTGAMIFLYVKKNSKTQKELSALLGIYNKDECRCVMKKIRRLIRPSTKDLYYYGQSVMADNKYFFTDIYKEDTEEYLDAKTINSNFNKPKMSARKVNKYIAVKTRNAIQDVVSKQEASTVFNEFQIIINVIGTLLKPVKKISYSAGEITKGIYYGLNEPILTEFIYQELIYNSTKSKVLDAWVLEIPLNTTITKSFVIIPNSRCGLKPMLAKLASDPQILLDVIECLTRRIIKLTVPVYTSSTTVENVLPALQSTGKFNRVVDTETSDIIDSCGKSLNRSITYIHEKSTVKFTREGVEPYKKASAEDCPECGEPVDICINYPAVYIYMNNGIILQTVIGEVERVESCTD